jgi:acyl-CoA thioesterase I
MNPKLRFNNMKYSIFSLWVLALGFFACQNEVKQPTANETMPAAPTAPGTIQKNIIFFGNSLTAAYQLSQEQGFPALIQRKIDALGLPYKCINAGLSGETTADGVARVGWVLNQPAAIFVLELGGNDVLRGLPLADSKKNLQAILDQVKAKYPDCKLVVTGMQAPPNMGKQYATEFKDIFPELAQKNKAALIPFLLEGVGGEPSLNLSDGIHPNTEGQKIVAENVWTVIKSLL